MFLISFTRPRQSVEYLTGTFCPFLLPRPHNIAIEFAQLATPPSSITMSVQISVIHSSEPNSPSILNGAAVKTTFHLPFFLHNAANLSKFHSSPIGTPHNANKLSCKLSPSPISNQQLPSILPHVRKSNSPGSGKLSNPGLSATIALK